MKTKAKCVILAAMVAVAIILTVTDSASAGKRTEFKNGYSIATSWATTGGSSATAGTFRAAGGTAGTASASGSRNAYIKTTMYSLLGAPIVDVKTGSYWKWGSGVVTSHSWNQPVVTKRWGGCTITYSVKWGVSGWRDWNGKSHGCWYQSVTVHVTESILKIGIVGEWDVIHEYWLRGNGTYKWHSNY